MFRFTHVLIFAAIFLLVSFSIFLINQKINVIRLESKVQKLNKQIRIQQMKYKIERYAGYNKINPDKKLVNIDGDSIIFSSIIYEKQALVFRYSYLGCNDCVVDLLTLLNEMQNKDELEIPILLIIYTENFRALLLENRNYNIHFPIYLVPNNDLIKSPIDEFNVPYFFLINKNMNCTDFYVPDKTTPDLTQKYLNFINSKYLEHYN